MLIASINQYILYIYTYIFINTATNMRDMLISCINQYIHIIINTALFCEGHVYLLHQSVYIHIFINTAYFCEEYVNLLHQSVYIFINTAYFREG